MRSLPTRAKRVHAFLRRGIDATLRFVFGETQDLPARASRHPSACGDNRHSVMRAVLQSSPRVSRTTVPWIAQIESRDTLASSRIRLDEPF